MSAHTEIADMLAGPRIGEQWAEQDREALFQVRQMVTNLQAFVTTAYKEANLEATKDALLRLNDCLDDGWSDSCGPVMEAIEAAQREAAA
ncbi:MAG: hypothetical protein AB7F22_28980 [Reyranella sp.]|uniref:hypothetical protein n=1 Tax=Reyranella sp. TaxID=1929291 RepID=UPI003D0E7CA0